MNIKVNVNREEEKRERIIKSYPSYFQYVKYMEVGNGWLDIISKMCSEIKETDEDGDFHFSQIKEKFSGLRVYYYGGGEKIEKIIREAEKQAGQTCEMCGRAGAIRRKGSWIKTVCEDCVF